MIQRKQFDDECDIINCPIMFLMSIGFCIISIDDDAANEAYDFKMMKRHDSADCNKTYLARFECWSEGGQLIFDDGD